jgi:hypothetical protein
VPLGMGTRARRLAIRRARIDRGPRLRGRARVLAVAFMSPAAARGSGGARPVGDRRLHYDHGAEAPDAGRAAARATVACSEARVTQRTLALAGA